MLYLEKHKDTARNVELISEFGKLEGWKTNIQKSFEFLYSNNNQKEKLTPFALTSKIIKYLEINMPQKAGAVLGKCYDAN